MLVVGGIQTLVTVLGACDLMAHVVVGLLSRGALLSLQRLLASEHNENATTTPDSPPFCRRFYVFRWVDADSFAVRSAYAP